MQHPVWSPCITSSAIFSRKFPPDPRQAARPSLVVEGRGDRVEHVPVVEQRRRPEGPVVVLDEAADPARLRGQEALPGQPLGPALGQVPRLHPARVPVGLLSQGTVMIGLNYYLET